MTTRALLALSTALLLGGCAAAEGEVAAVDEAAVTTASPEAFAFHTDLVADASQCRRDLGADCADVDQDGLTDAWEDAVLARFQPRLELDEKEHGMSDPAFRTGTSGRVVSRPGDPGHVVVFFAFAWSEDYGSCGFTEHHGDTERAVIELARTAGTTGDATMVKAYTAAHEGDITDKSHLFDDASELAKNLEFLSENGSPRWLLYTSRDKHGTFPSKKACESSKWPCLADYCGADGKNKDEYRRLTPILNAGEPDHPRESSWAPFGYDGVDVWTAKKFCGLATSGDCDEAPRASLVRDPFSKKDI